MRTIEVSIYKFEELSEEAQQSAISNPSDINVDYEWWDYDGLLDLTQDEMDEAEIEPGEIKDVLFSYTIESFDIDRGQYVQFENVVVNNEEAFRKFLKIPEELWKQCSYYFHNCAESKNTFIEFALDNEESTTEEEYNILERAIGIMGDKIHEAWVSLRNDYEYQTSEEVIKDTILANEYEFYENGKLI